MGGIRHHEASETSAHSIGLHFKHALFVVDVIPAVTRTDVSVNFPAGRRRSGGCGTTMSGKRCHSDPGSSAPPSPGRARPTRRSRRRGGGVVARSWRSVRRSGEDALKTSEMTVSKCRNQNAQPTMLSTPTAGIEGEVVADYPRGVGIALVLSPAVRKSVNAVTAWQSLFAGSSLCCWQCGDLLRQRPG